MTLTDYYLSKHANNGSYKPISGSKSVNTTPAVDSAPEGLLKRVTKDKEGKI